MQFIQIITIALPSVPIQVAVGVIFGTWRGFLVCYLGYVSANALIFISVRKLGAKLEQLLPGKPVEKTGSKKRILLPMQSILHLVFSLHPFFPLFRTV